MFPSFMPPLTRKASKLAHSAGGNPFATPSFEQIVEEEMKGLEDFIPPPPPAKDDTADTVGFGPSKRQSKLEETLKHPQQGRSRP